MQSASATSYLREVEIGHKENLNRGEHECEEGLGGNENRNPERENASLFPPKRPSLRERLQAEDTHLLGNTADLTTLFVSEVSGVCITPDSLHEAVRGTGDVNGLYHLAISIQHVLDQRYPTPGYRQPTEDSSGKPVKEPVPDRRLVQDTMERLLVEIGSALYDRVGGPILLPIDPRRHNNVGGLVRSAKRMVAMLTAKGIDKKQVIVSIVATEDGVKAIQVLAAARINTNLILVSGLRHAMICVEAGPAAISIAVRPLLQAREKRQKQTFPNLLTHPGITDILAIIEYFKRHKIATRILGTDFEELAELAILSGFDAVFLSAVQLEDVRWRSDPQFPTMALRKLHEMAVFRALNGEYPCKVLANIQPGTGGFLRTLSPATREEIFDTLYPEMYRMQDVMNAVEAIVYKALGRQVALRTLSMDALCDLWERKARREEPLGNREKINHDSEECL
ncbi:BZIP domain-containing protein [Mycena indigotica]|uniref:BZIP domain-containing protein n=1 Tax=Mycena indigotica TaxID=2126181 RepID=A0A8H6S4L2_9AGAR|nr:BZIP domain-containing protein [Mycena indigotica]KAF7293045.1 BZIP domain-containing protein [Mycena indigotica]